MPAKTPLTLELATAIVERHFGPSGINADLANQVQPLATEQYAFSDVFLRELIQNASDAEANTATIEVIVKESRGTRIPAKIIFKNDGLAISAEDFEALLLPHKSTKRGLASAIGNKGVGHYSVFKVARAITVRSAGVQCQILREHYKVPLEEVRADPSSAGRSGVSFELDLIPEYAAAKQLDQLLPEHLAKFAHEFLWFCPLESLVIVDGVKKAIVAKFQRKVLPYDLESEKDGPAPNPSGIAPKWYKIHITDPIQDREEQLLVCEGECHPSLKRVPTGARQKYAIRMGFQSTGGHLARYRDAPFFVWLPSELATGLGFAVDAPFYVNQDRNTIAEDLSFRPWNEMLVQQLASLLPGAVATLLRRFEQAALAMPLGEIPQRYSTFIETFAVESAGTDRVGILPRLLGPTIRHTLQQSSCVLVTGKRELVSIKHAFIAPDPIIALDLLPCVHPNITHEARNLLERVGVLPARLGDVVTALEALGKLSSTEMCAVLHAKPELWLARIYGFLGGARWSTGEVYALKKRVLVLASDFQLKRPESVFWCPPTLWNLAARHLPASIIHQDLLDIQGGGEGFLRRVLGVPDLSADLVLDTCIMKGIWKIPVTDAAVLDLARALDYLSEKGASGLFQSMSKIPCILAADGTWHEPRTLASSRDLPPEIIDLPSCLVHPTLERQLLSNILDKLRLMPPEEIADLVVDRLLPLAMPRDPAWGAKLAAAVEFLARQPMSVATETKLCEAPIFPDAAGELYKPAELYLPDAQDRDVLGPGAKFLQVRAISNGARQFLAKKLRMKDRPTTRDLRDALVESASADNLDRSRRALELFSRRVATKEFSKANALFAHLQRNVRLKSQGGTWQAPLNLLLASEQALLVADPSEIIHGGYFTGQVVGSSSSLEDATKSPLFVLLYNLGVNLTVPPARLVTAVKGLEQTRQPAKLQQLMRYLASADLTPALLANLRSQRCILLRSGRWELPQDAVLESETTRLFYGPHHDFAAPVPDRVRALYKDLGIVEEIPPSDVVRKFLAIVKNVPAGKDQLIAFYEFFYGAYHNLPKEDRAALRVTPGVPTRSGNFLHPAECYLPSAETSALYAGFLQPTTDVPDKARALLVFLGVKAGTSLEEVVDFIIFLCAGPEKVPLPAGRAERVHQAFNLLKARYPDMVLVRNLIQGQRVLLDAKNVPHRAGELFWDDNSEVAQAFRDKVPMASGTLQNYLLHLGVEPCAEACTRTLIERVPLNPQPPAASTIQQRIRGIEKAVEYMPATKEWLQNTWAKTLRGVEVKVAPQITARITLGGHYKNVLFRTYWEASTMFFVTGILRGQELTQEGLGDVARLLAPAIAQPGLENYIIPLIITCLALERADAAFRPSREGLRVTQEGTLSANALPVPPPPTLYVNTVDLRSFKAGFPSTISKPRSSKVTGVSASRPRINLQNLKSAVPEEASIRIPPELRLEDDLTNIPEIHLTRRVVDGVPVFSAKGVPLPSGPDVKAMRGILDNIARALEIYPRVIKITTMREPQGFYRPRPSPGSKDANVPGEIFVSSTHFDPKSDSASYIRFIFTVAHEAAHAAHKTHGHEHAALAEELSVKAFQSIFSLNTT